MGDRLLFLLAVENVGKVYGMRLIDNTRLDKGCFEISNLNDEPLKNGQMPNTPLERIEGLEILRQIWHSYDPDTERLPRVYTVIEQ